MKKAVSSFSCYDPLHVQNTLKIYYNKTPKHICIRNNNVWQCHSEKEWQKEKRSKCPTEAACFRVQEASLLDISSPFWERSSLFPSTGDIELEEYYVTILHHIRLPFLSILTSSLLEKDGLGWPQFHMVKVREWSKVKRKGKSMSSWLNICSAVPNAYADPSCGVSNPIQTLCYHSS